MSLWGSWTTTKQPRIMRWLLYESCIWCIYDRSLELLTCIPVSYYYATTVPIRPFKAGALTNASRNVRKIHDAQFMTAGASIVCVKAFSAGNLKDGTQWFIIGCLYSCICINNKCFYRWTYIYLFYITLSEWYFSLFVSVLFIFIH